MKDETKTKSSKARGHRQLRAFDDEFRVIKEFSKIVQEIGAMKAQEIIDVIKQEYRVSAS